MPFRERVKRAFTRSSATSTTSSNSSKSSTGTNSPWPDPSLIYKPGEKMPMPKYRRPVNKEHKAKLEAFDFATAWRRKSCQSLYSPMGSRMPSRKNSFVLQQHQRRSCALGADLDEGADEDEGGVMNGVLSRRQSKDYSSSDLSSMDTRSHGTPSHHEDSSQPFNADDLTLAFQRSNLDVPL